MKEAHLRQDGVLEATLENAEVGKVLFDKATANGYIQCLINNHQHWKKFSKMKVGGQDE